MVNPPDNDHSDDDIFKYITFGDTPSPQPVASSSSTTFSSLLLPNNQDDEERLRQDLATVRERARAAVSQLARLTMDPSLESQLTAIEAEYDPHPGISKTIGMEPPAAAAERQDAVKSSLVVRAPTRARPTPYPVGSKARSQVSSRSRGTKLTSHLAGGSSLAAVVLKDANKDAKQKLQAAKAKCVSKEDKAAFDFIVTFVQNFVVGILVAAGLFALRERAEVIHKLLPSLPVVFSKQLEKAGLPSQDDVNPILFEDLENIVKRAQRKLMTTAILFGDSMGIKLPKPEVDAPRGSKEFVELTRQITDRITNGDLFHKSTDGLKPGEGYKFRHIALKKAIIVLMYRGDDNIATNYPALCDKSVPIEAIASICTAMVHRGRSLVHRAGLAQDTKELALAFSSKEYQSVFMDFFLELQAERDADNGFDEYLKEMAEAAMENHVLYPNPHAIHEIIS